jgi:hypothetical protein
VFVALGIGALIIFAAILCGLSWLPFLRIKTITVEGEKTVSQETIERTAQEHMVGGYLHFFAKSNVFLYPRRTIEHDLAERYPTLATVKVKAATFTSLAISVSERSPAALWCGATVASSTGACYLIDKDGVIYAPAVVYSGDVYQRYFGGMGDMLPRQFLPAETFRSLSVLLVTIAKNQSLALDTIYIDEVGDVHATFTNGFSILFASTDKGGDVLNRFSLALSADVFKTHGLADLEYLDLRFGNKLYYKLKTATP